MRFSEKQSIREYVVRPILKTPTGDCIATLSSTVFTTGAALYEIQRMKRYGLIKGIVLDVTYCHATDRYLVEVE